MQDVPAAPELDALRDSLNLSPLAADAFRLETPIDDGVIDVRVPSSPTPGTTTEAETLPITVETALLSLRPKATSP